MQEYFTILLIGIVIMATHKFKQIQRKIFVYSSEESQSLLNISITNKQFTGSIFIQTSTVTLWRIYKLTLNKSSLSDLDLFLSLVCFN